MKPIHLSIIGVFAALYASGCATSKPLPPGLHTESKSGGGVKVLSVGLLHDDTGLLVHGSVERTPGYSNSPFRHLDVEVIGPTGQLSSQQTITFSPNPIPHSRFGSRRASYTARLKEIPPPGSTIRVAVDSVSISKCQLPKTGDQ
jgi:hypothetical protein